MPSVCQKRNSSQERESKRCCSGTDRPVASGGCDSRSVRSRSQAVAADLKRWRPISRGGGRSQGVADDLKRWRPISRGGGRSQAVAADLKRWRPICTLTLLCCRSAHSLLPADLHSRRLLPADLHTLLRPICTLSLLPADLPTALLRRLFRVKYLRCKFCGREGTVTMMPGKGKPLTQDASEEGKYAPLMMFDCRGYELEGFLFGDGWKAESMVGTKFENIDLSGEEFSEYDEKGKCPVMISNLNHKFEVVK